jgi:serine/threonine protein kinase
MSPGDISDLVLSDFCYLAKQKSSLGSLLTCCLGVPYLMIAASNDPDDPLYNTIKLVDFGLAKLTENAKTALKTTCGTPYFLAPEIIDNSTPTYGAEVDIW